MDQSDSDNPMILDLSKQCLKKIPKKDDAQNVKYLILDENELQKIDNIDLYLRIEKLSLCKNQLLRMYGVCRLHNLKELHLAFNGILTIEGLKELIHLTHLNLEGNNIKTIEHLNTNINLEYLNLSENSISSISDISFLKSLKELYLHGNRITHLRQCDKYLPISLETLTIAKNAIGDLNEICTLNNLCNLNSISIVDNPCVQMTGNVIGFDYRPFVLNWCMSIKIIDSFMVNPIESLKAEWLYSQGKGRQFRIGEQLELSRYLSSVCPLSGETLENEKERKLRLILSKAQQHQRQLQEEILETNTSGSNSPSSYRRKITSSRLQSPRFSRLSGGRQGSPDSMSSSFHGTTSNSSLISNNQIELANQMTTSLIGNIKSSNDNNIMIQSLDPTILLSNNNNNNNNTVTTPTVAGTPIATRLPIANLKYDTINKLTQSNQIHDQIRQSSPLVSASKMVPVPESLMSPDCPVAIVQRISIVNNNNNNNNNNNSSNISSNKSVKTMNKINSGGSPKLNRSPANVNNNKRQQIERSPVLNTRKSNNNINNVLRTNHSNETITSGKCLNSNSNSSQTPLDNNSSDDDSDHINMDKLKAIRDKVAQRKEQIQKSENNEIITNKQMKNLESAVILIQKIWRGYNTRKRTNHIANILQKKRTQEYIIKLTHDMETTKVALENERKIQQLQMQAINALWKKVSAMQSNNTSNTITNDSLSNAIVTTNGSEDTSNVSVVHELTKTCTVLTSQVQQLQCSMRDIVNCMTVFCSLPQENLKIVNTIDSITTAGGGGGGAGGDGAGDGYEVGGKKDNCATQTEIIAVHTPQIESLPFPFMKNNKILIRPSTLLLESTETVSSARINNNHEHELTNGECNDTKLNLIIEKELLIEDINRKNADDCSHDDVNLDNFNENSLIKD